MVILYDKKREYKIKKENAWVIIEKTKSDKGTYVSKRYYDNEIAAKTSLNYLKNIEQRRQQHREYRKIFYNNFKTEEEANKGYRNYIFKKNEVRINER